jgi:hypothetical protein
MKQQSSSTMRLRQAELTILKRGSKGGEIHQNGNLVQNPAQKGNPDKKPSHEDSMVITRLRVGASLLYAPQQKAMLNPAASPPNRKI